VPPQSIQRIVGEMCHHNRYRELLERCAATRDTENCWKDVPPQSILRIVGEMCRHNRYRELLERCAATIDTQNCWGDVPPRWIQRTVGGMCRHSRYGELLEKCAATVDTENCLRDMPPQSIQRIVGEMCRHSRYKELLERCAATINTQTQLPTMKKLTIRIRRVLPNSKINQVHFLPHDNAKPHISLRTREASTARGWIIIPHLLCRPDLAPTAFNQFGPLNDALQVHHFSEDDELQHSL
jgi:hypothetical protein